MNEIDRERPIVVGLDGSDNSLAALRWALREGVATGAPVQVVHGWTAQTLSDVAFTPDHSLMTASECMLDNEVGIATAEIPMSAATSFSLPGNPASVLVDRSAGARMLVLGVRQTAAMRDLAYGAVESVCRRHAVCPVVSVDRAGGVTWHRPNARHQVGAK